MRGDPEIIALLNEQLTSDRAFVTALKHLCQANVLAMRAILSTQPQAWFIQSESSEYFHAEDPASEPLADFLNQKRFLPLDFTYGQSVTDGCLSFDNTLPVLTALAEAVGKRRAR